jgi:ABC-type uncharacterized transport system involved in gliding motility auxiliary subunit
MRKLFPLIFGIITILLLSASIVLYVIYPDPSLMYWGFAATGLLAAAWAVESRSALKAFFTRRSTYYGANVAFIVALILGILVFINVIAKDHHWRKDMTRGAANSLSPQSVKVVKDLKQKVKAYYFSSLQEKERGEPLFKRFEYESKQFAYEFVDTARRPTFVQSMQVKKNETAVLVLEGTNKRVSVDAITEEKITNGLIKLLKTRDQTIYFTIGHGERPLQAGDAGSYSVAKTELEKQGYTVKELNLFSEGKIPADASEIVVAGPTRAFFPKELEILNEWMKKGGRAIFALDLDPANNGLAKGSRQVADWLKAFGVEVQDRMLVDPTSKAANVEPQVLLGFSGSKDHVVTKDFAYSNLAANFLFPLTTNIDANSTPGYVTTPLVITSQNAWAESDWSSLKSGLVSYNQGQDFKGRMALALAVEDEKAASAKPDADGGPAKGGHPMRLVVFATSTFATDTMIDKVGNRDLLLNAASWLADDEQLISIRAREGEELLNFDNNTLNLVLLVTVFLMPALIVVAGVTVWIRRSKL